MPASVYEPIASVLRNSFHGPKSSNSNGLNSKMDSSLQKSLLVPVSTLISPTRLNFVNFPPGAI